MSAVIKEVYLVKCRGDANSKSLCVGVIEKPVGVDRNEVLNCWRGTQGLEKHDDPNVLAKTAYYLEDCPVIPWDSIKHTWTPYCERDDQK